MYWLGKRADVGGMRISAAAQTAPAGGFAGMIEAVEMTEAVPLGAVGIFWTDSVDASSWRVYRRSSEKTVCQDTERGRIVRTHC
jgi:hypothetical protein